MKIYYNAQIWFRNDGLEFVVVDQHETVVLRKDMPVQIVPNPGWDVLKLNPENALAWDAIQRLATLANMAVNAGLADGAEEEYPREIETAAEFVALARAGKLGAGTLVFENDFDYAMLQGVSEYTLSEDVTPAQLVEALAATLNIKVYVT